jgi:uncharacterized protein
MKSLITRLTRVPVLTLIVVVAITVLFGMAAVNGFRIETDLNEYMPNDHPAFVFARQAEEQFNIADGVLVALYNPDGIYQLGTLAKIDALGRALGGIEGIEAGDVMSLATADNISADEWGLEVRPFMDDIPSTDEDRASLEEAVRSNPMIHGRIVSTDGTATLIIARPAEGGFSDSVYEDIRDLVVEYEGPEEIYVAGRPIVEGALAELGPADMVRMGPLVLIAIALVLLLVLRSVRNMILSMLIVGMSVIWTFGLMAALGIPVYAVSTMIPVMLVAIGVAYSIHVFNSATVYLEEHPTATSRHLADHAIATITRPVVMAAITTVVGFLSLLSSAVLPVRYFGLFTAFGVFAAMVLSLALIPSSFMLFGVKPPWKLGRKKQASPTRFAERIVDILVRRWKPVVAVAAALVVIGLVAIPRVWIDSSFLSNFTRESDIVRTDRFVNEHFAGTSTLNVILEAQEADVFKRPEVLAAMAQLQDELEADPMVGDTFALTDFIERMNQVMHEEETEYLLLYEMSADPESMEQVVDYEYQRANLTVQVKDDSSQTLTAVIAASDAYHDVFADFGISLHYAGSGYRALVFSELILEGQIKSLAISLAVVVVLLSIMFRSVVIGLMGATPILIMAVLNFGVMGVLGIPLSISTALISSIAVGIGIDYAIHVIERYQEYMADRGDRREAAILTMHHSGRAIMYNAVVVASGFAVLLFSVFPPNRQVGGLVALNMAVSFMGTATVLFLLLYHRNRPGKTDQALSLSTAEEEETHE